VRKAAPAKADGAAAPAEPKSGDKTEG
jgi:hypothetical protein